MDAVIYVNLIYGVVCSGLRECWIEEAIHNNETIKQNVQTSKTQINVLTLTKPSFYKSHLILGDGMTDNCYQGTGAETLPVAALVKDTNPGASLASCQHT